MKNRKKGFTLSEVIITLVVLGIVAAITVPMMSNSASDKKWNVARQKAQATIGEAFRLMTVNGEIDTKLSTQQFVEKVIPKYLKINKTCTIAKASECGMSTAANFYKRPNGEKTTLTTQWTTSTAAQVVTSPGSGWDRGQYTYYNHANPNTNDSFFFQTLDGFSVNFFYNPYCAIGTKDKPYHIISADHPYPQLTMDVICLMGVYDMNGKKGPNKVGMDVGFVGSFYNGFEAKAVAVLPHSNEKQVNPLPRIGNNYQGAAANFCNNLSKDKEWILPDLNEASLLYLNVRLIKDPGFTVNCPGSDRGFIYWTRTSNRAGSAWVECTENFPGRRLYIGNSYNDTIIKVRCVRANALK